MQYRIFEENIPALRKVIEKQNKKAAKLGVPTTTWSIVDYENVTDLDGLMVDRFAIVDIESAAPILDGYEFIATLQFAGEAGTIIRTVPTFGGTLPLRFRTSNPGTCDHCKKFRNRIDCYVIRNIKEDVYYQVGSSCLQDFIGTDRVASIAALAEMISLIHEAAEGFGENRGSGGERTLVLESALAWAAEAMFRIGWISRTKAREQNKDATVDFALRAIDNNARGYTCTYKSCGDDAYNDKCPNHYIPSEAAFELATKALEWAPAWIERELPRAESDYIWNMKVVLASDVIAERSYGLAASLLGAYQRDMERNAKIERERAQSVSTFQGEIGDRIVRTLTVKAFRYIESDYGTSTLITYMDADGNCYKWFASGSHHPVVDSTETYQFRVKDHKEFGGIQETYMTRAKVYETPEAAKERKKQAKIAKATYETLQAKVTEVWERSPNSEEYQLARKAAQDAYKIWQDVK